jgi:hypothetical protein
VFKEQEVSNASPDWPASRVIWCALFHVVNRYVGYLLPMPGVFRDYPAPVIRNTQDGTEITLMRWACRRHRAQVGRPSPISAGARRARSYEPERASWRFCSQACRQSAYRKLCADATARALMF